MIGKIKYINKGVNMLNILEHAILSIIDKFQKENGNSPPLGELSIAFGYSSSAGINYPLNDLIRKKYIVKTGDGRITIINQNWENEKISNPIIEKIENAKEYFKRVHNI
jgi:SOS-response transcriptional repressor LexA